MMSEFFLQKVPNTVSTLDLANAAQQLLANYRYLAWGDLYCTEETNGILSIRGKVYSYYHKQLAQEIVRRIKGVQRIDNQLTVQQSEKQYSQREI